MTTRATVSLHPSERWLFLGKTGEGKTHLARHLLRQVAARGWRVVIVDPKKFWMGRRPKWAKEGTPGTVDVPHLVTTFNPKLAVQCYQPATLPAWADSGLDKLAHDILRWASSNRQGGVYCFFDEAGLVADQQHIHPGVSALWTQGRALDVCAMVCSQRPRRVPEVFKSQADNWAIFWMPGKKDRQEAAEYTGSDNIVSQELPPYHWMYWQAARRDAAQLMEPVDGTHKVPGSQVAKSHG